MWTGYYGIESSLNFLLIFQDREDDESDNIDEDDKITNDEDDEKWQLVTTRMLNSVNNMNGNILEETQVFFKKHKFKKHEAQNAEILRNI